VFTTARQELLAVLFCGNLHLQVTRLVLRGSPGEVRDGKLLSTIRPCPEPF